MVNKLKKIYESPELKKYSIQFKDALDVSVPENTESTGYTHPTDDWEEDDGF